MRGNKPILLVEDDQVDVMTVQRALKDLNVTNRLEITGDGEQALSFLRSPDNSKPCVILLDLSMPRMNGIEFLRVAKQDTKFRKIPVVVMTSSEEEQDKVDSFDLGVAGYIVKPVAYQDFVEAMKTIDMYWTLSEFPQDR